MAAASQQAEIGISGAVGTEEQRRVAEQQRTHNARRKQALSLQRENILSQRTSNPARRAALEAALKQIEGEIESLG